MPSCVPLVTDIEMLLEVAGLPDGQATLLVSMTETLSPSAGMYVKELLLVPALAPFTSH